MKLNLLNHRQCLNAKPGEKVRYLSDGGGLRLRIMPSGSKSWIQTLTVNRKAVYVGYGGFPSTSLAEARERRDHERKVARNGGDPRQAPKAAMPTLAEVSETCVEAKRTSALWKHPEREAAQWRSRFALHVPAEIACLPVSDINTPQAMAILEPVWGSKPTQGRRLRRDLQDVIERAVQTGHHSPDNPFGQRIVKVLGAQRRTKHHGAVTWRDVPDAVQRIRNADCYWIGTRLALEFQILACVRPVNVCIAQWSDVDMEAKEWRIPPDQVKGRRADWNDKPHRVPLNKRCLEILAEARKLQRPDSDLVFPARQGGQIHSDAPRKLLRHCEIDSTRHGFRNAFADWAENETNARRVLVKKCLMQKPGTGTVDSAYFRSTSYKRRKKLMRKWAKYIG